MRDQYDSLVPQLALTLIDILVAQREMLAATEMHVGAEPSDERPWELLDAEAHIAALYDQGVHTFGPKLNEELFSLLVQRSLGSVEDNGGHERERILRQIAAEHNTKPLERP